MSFLAKNMIYLRKKLGLTQTDIAVQVERRVSTISNWESGNSEPSVQEIMKISIFFGISIDNLVFYDLEKGNLIPEDYFSNFKKKGNLKGNLIGNPIHQIPAIFPSKPAPPSAQDQQQAGFWAVLTQLRQMAQTLDVVRDTVERIDKKTGSQPA